MLVKHTNNCNFNMNCCTTYVWPLWPIYLWPDLCKWPGIFLFSHCQRRWKSTKNWHSSNTREEHNLYRKWKIIYTEINTSCAWSVLLHSKFEKDLSWVRCHSKTRLHQTFQSFTIITQSNEIKSIASGAGRANVPRKSKYLSWPIRSIDPHRSGLTVSA